MTTAHCAKTNSTMRWCLNELPTPPIHPRSRRNLRWRIIKPLTLALGAIFGTTLATAANAFPVTWTFFETGCTSVSVSIGCDNLQLPAAEAQLSLPDIASSGTYHFSSFPPIETGDTNFLFEWGGLLAAPPRSGSSCRSPEVGLCDWDITFASSPSGLDIMVDFSWIQSYNIRLGPTGGSIGSDAPMPGCGTFAQCSVTGFWTLGIPVPEPSSLTVMGMASAFFLIKLGRRRARQKTVLGGKWGSASL